eukprot:m51a1_g8083 hypothetical protein (612) ;mRNA; r:25578-28298
MSANTEYVGLAIPLADPEFLQKNPDITLLGRFVSWLTNAARWKWVRGGMNQKDIIEMAMAHKCTKGAAEVAKLARAELTVIQAAQTEVDDRFRVIDEEEDVMSSQAPVPSPAPKKKKKKVSTGHAEELPPSMSLNQINAQYKFGEVTDISFGDIFGHVFERVIGVQAVAQQYMAAKKHGRSTMFEQEIPVIRYGSGSNASYLQLDHNHRIISILFIHVMEHYNFQLPAISDAMAASSSFWRMLCLIPIHVTVYRSTMPVPLIMYFGKAINEITTAARHETWIDQLRESPLTHSELYNIALRECSFLSHTRVKENFFAKFMNAIDRIDPSVLALINNNLMAPTPHPCFRSRTNLTNLSFLYLSTACQMTCLKYIFSDNGTDITTNSALTDLIDHWEQHFTEPLSWKELTDKPFKKFLDDRAKRLSKTSIRIATPTRTYRHRSGFLPLGTSGDLPVGFSVTISLPSTRAAESSDRPELLLNASGSVPPADPLAFYSMWAVFVSLSMSIQAVSAFEVAIITNIIQWEDESPMSNDDFGLLSSGLSDGLWNNISFNTPVLEPSIIKLKNYIMTRMAQQAKKTNKGKPAPTDETSGDESDADGKSDGDGNGDGDDQ